jgi:hypothetical protein
MMFVRGRVAAGLMTDIFAVEAGPYLMAPFPLFQTLHQDPIRGAAFPHTGFEITFLFGDFDPR